MVGDDRERLHQAKRLVGTDILRYPLYGLKAGALESLSRRRCLCGNADLERLSEFPKTLYEFV
jgi:hypothetical protein